ncbi:MAG: hypothetical protein RL693_612 [Verrucomicrobiota bacterium]|jgi:uncharacterized membrane protein YdbT with pleckstrin-like domain
MLTEDSPIPAPAQEATLWKGHSSQWVHFWFYFFCILLAIGCAVGALFTAGLALIGLIVPAVMWSARWWMTRATHYELTTQRLRITSGILNRRLDELELYRVKDYTLEEPLLYRILKLGNLNIVTSDSSSPLIAMHAISDVQDVREKLRAAVQSERDRKRVREMDVDHSDGNALG